jgi:hypothetical protein
MHHGEALVGQVPQGIRQQLNLSNDAKGIDGIFRVAASVGAIGQRRSAGVKAGKF